jgi:gamma-glutamyltranspeptidase/glutathione hydrolase
MVLIRSAAVLPAAARPVETSMLRRVFALVLPAFTLAAAAADRITDAPFASRSEVLAPHAMAATSQPLATQIALDVMKRGGNAVDAAIAANAALGLMEPTGCGIGGDLFAIVWDARSRKLHGYNSSGRAPKSLTYERLRAELEKLGEKEIPALGPLPVTVPGAVDGWFALHGRFGRLPMESLLQPSIDYARSGFPVTDVISFFWQRNVRSLLKYPGIREQFTHDGEGPAKGRMWRNPNLAST